MQQLIKGGEYTFVVTFYTVIVFLTVLPSELIYVQIIPYYLCFKIMYKKSM